MKAILMPFQPQWCAKILNREKTIEIRKRFPFDYKGWVYVYCTKSKPYLYEVYSTNEDWYTYKDGYNLTNWKNEAYIINGKVVGRFWCNEITKIKYGRWVDQDTFNYYGYHNEWKDLVDKSMMTQMELYNYGSKLLAISITRLEIFDKPKELGEFYKPKCKHCGDMYECMLNIYKHGCDYTEFDTNPDGSINIVNCSKPKEPLTRAFQSWGYVEVEE